MIWNAINSGNKNIAELNGDVGCYVADVAPFAGLKEWDQEHLNKLHRFLPPGRRAAIACDERIALDKTRWKLLAQMECYQMVYEKPVADFTTAASSLIRALDESHVPQMLELTKLTKPGPFLERTILFGNYFGIFVDGRLAAMTGQRMHPIPYLEVSAVCSHPDFRGRGYAKAVMLHVMKLILDKSYIPFLHVLTGNATAIGLYESIGFRIRKKVFIDVMEKVNG